MGARLVFVATDGSYPLDLLDLRALLLVIDHGGFRAAAAAAAVSQPSLTRRVTALERRLGLKLVVRSSRGATPSREGRALLPVVRRLLAEHAALLEAAAAVAEPRTDGARHG